MNQIGALRQPTHRRQAEPKEALVVEFGKDMEALVERFLHRKRTDVVALRNALQEGDYERIANLAHDLKGAGGAFGFSELSLLGRKLMQAAGAADGEDVESLLERLEQYLVRVQPIFS